MRFRMPLWPWLVLALAGALPAAAEDAPPGEAREAEKQLKAGDRDPDFLAQVNSSIQSGLEFVKGQQKEDGSFDYVHDFSTSRA